MSKSIKRSIILASILVTTYMLTFMIVQRQHRNVLLEMIIYPPAIVWGNNYQAYQFILRNNGVLISYSGVRVDNYIMSERFNIPMWPIIRRRSRTTLNDEDFQNILELATILSENRGHPLSRSSRWDFMLFIGEDVYLYGLEFYKIADELMRLSPLTNHPPFITPELLELLDYYSNN